MDTLEAPPASPPADHVAAPPAANATNLKVWIPAARLPVLTAVEGAGITVLDAPTGADHAVVSTRLARHRITEYTAQAIEAGLPVVVLVHPGGESIAVEALRAGGHVAIAEGDAEALRALDAGIDLHADRVNSLLDAYEVRLGRSQAATRSNVSMFDPVSGLPAAGALAARFSAAGYDPDQQLRMVAIKVNGLLDGTRMRLGAEGQALLHRRIAITIKTMSANFGDLYDNGDGSFLLLAPQLSVFDAERLGRTLADVVGHYSPDGHMPLEVAVGHAGPECSTDLATLRELAGRAESAAGQEERSTVLGAGELVGPLATATELEVTLRLADLAGERTGAISRSEVATVAGDLALRLGFEGRERTLVRFCAEVTDIGAALSSDAGQQTELAARLVGATAGPTVAAVLRAVGEHWDGSGLPDGAAGADIPVAARIIAVAIALVAGRETTNATQAIEEITALSGTRFDPTVVSAAEELVRQR